MSLFLNKSSKINSKINQVKNFSRSFTLCFTPTTLASATAWKEMTKFPSIGIKSIGRIWERIGTCFTPETPQISSVTVTGFVKNFLSSWKGEA